MSDRKPPETTTDQELTARVDALEIEVAAQGDAIVVLTERVAALEDLAEITEPPLYPDHELPEPPVRPDHELPPVEPPIEPPAVTGMLTIELALPGGALTFAEADATDVGDYVGEFVHQRCLAQRQGPWTVFFRPDADGARQEIVVEYGGWDFSTSPPKPLVTPAHIPAYTATIRRDGEVLVLIEVPAHWWLARWRWQSAPRPVVRSAEGLVAMKATLPLSEEALWDDPADLNIAQATWTGPMGTGGLTATMSTTGDRNELGPITNLQGSYLLRGNQEALEGLLAQAEAVGSWPFYIRDPATNCLLDIYQHPNHATASTASASKYPVLQAHPSTDPTYFKLDNGHMGNVAYVPWLLTDDPYFLEGCQAQALFAPMNTNYYSINEKLPGVAGLSQKRAFGWSLRHIVQMAAMAPEAPPSWLLPRSLFKHMADDTLVYVRDRSMPSQIKSGRIFSMVAPQNGAIAPWQEGFCACVLGWMRFTGCFPEWHDSIDWMAQTVIQVTADPAQGGWDRRWPTAYWIILTRGRTAAHDLSIDAPGVNIPYNSAIPEQYHDETPDSWGELWSLYQQRMELEGSPITMGPEDKIYQNKIDNPKAAGSPLHYMEEITGALGALALGGVPGAAEHQAWMRAKLPAVIDSFGGNFKFSFRYAYLAP